jgi:hypothetical protein
MAQAFVEYNHNNSGGVDWLKAQDWQKLVDAGWIVDQENSRIYSAKRIGLSLYDAIVEWQNVTGLDPAAEGCNCCGRPHSFYEYDEKENFVACMSINYGPATWEVSK